MSGSRNRLEYSVLSLINTRVIQWEDIQALDPGFKFSTRTLGKMFNNAEAVPQLRREGDSSYLSGLL